MGIFNSKDPNPSQAKGVFSESYDLDKDLADAKEKIELLREASAKINDNHADLKRYHIPEKYKEAARDLKEIAKRSMKNLNSYETIDWDARRQGKYNSKGPAQRTEKKTDITDIAVRELEKNLTSEQFHQGMILTVKTIKTGSSISTGIPLIVICLNSSRLGVDFSNAVSEVPDMSNAAVLIFHLLKEHALPTQPSNTVLSKTEVMSVGTIIDVAFLEDIGLYDCEMNRMAYKALLTFIKEHWCKTSAGEFP